MGSQLICQQQVSRLDLWISNEFADPVPPLSDANTLASLVLEHLVALPVGSIWASTMRNYLGIFGLIPLQMRYRGKTHLQLYFLPLTRSTSNNGVPSTWVCRSHHGCFTHLRIRPLYDVVIIEASLILSPNCPFPLLVASGLIPLTW